MKSGWKRVGGIFLRLLVSFSFHYKGKFLLITGKIKAVYKRGPFSQLLTVPLSRLFSYISLHTQILSPVLHLFTPDRLISTNSWTSREHHSLNTWPWSPEYSCSLLSPSVSQPPSVLWASDVCVGRCGTALALQTLLRTSRSFRQLPPVTGWSSLLALRMECSTAWTPV